VAIAAGFAASGGGYQRAMYAVPLVVLALAIAALGVLASPIFALIIAVPAFLAFLAYVGTRRRADERQAEATAGDPADAPQQERAPGRGGIWGERERKA
jgi:uncharacterized membrane protein